MSEAILVAVITAAASIIGQLIISRAGASKERVERAKHEQNVVDRIASLERKVDVHNGYAEMFAKTSGDIQTMGAHLAELRRDVEKIESKMERMEKK